MIPYFRTNRKWFSRMISEWSLRMSGNVWKKDWESLLMTWQAIRRVWIWTVILNPSVLQSDFFPPHPRRTEDEFKRLREVQTEWGHQAWQFWRTEGRSVIRCGIWKLLSPDCTAGNPHTPTHAHTHTELKAPLCPRAARSRCWRPSEVVYCPERLISLFPRSFLVVPFSFDFDLLFACVTVYFRWNFQYVWMGVNSDHCPHGGVDSGRFPAASSVHWALRG